MPAILDSDTQATKDLDGCYTTTLTVIYWRHHLTNSELYEILPKVSRKIKERRLRVADHCPMSLMGRLYQRWCSGHQNMPPGNQWDSISRTLKFLGKTVEGRFQESRAKHNWFEERLNISKQLMVLYWIHYASVCWQWSKNRSTPPTNVQYRRLLYKTSIFGTVILLFLPSTRHLLKKLAGRALKSLTDKLYMLTFPHELFPKKNCKATIIWHIL